MKRAGSWGLVIAAVVLGAIAVSAMNGWCWTKEHMIDTASIIILAITAWAVIQYARDTRAQTAALSRRHIEPYLSCEEPVWTPSLGTNTLYAISSPDGSRVTSLMKLRIWIGDEVVEYNGRVDASGLHKGQSRWSLAGGQFRGVVEPGHAILQHVQRRMSAGITLTELLRPDSSAAPEDFRRLPENRKIRAQLLTRFPRTTDSEGTPAEQWHLQPSSIYYLRWTGEQRHVGSAVQDGFLWIPDPNAEPASLPPGANSW
jgi:hypothetical protein